MKVSELRPGMLLRPKKGFTWREQNSAYLEKIMCLTVFKDNMKKKSEDIVVIYVGEREDEETTYGKHIVLWKGNRISVNPSAWRCIENVHDQC